MLCDARAMRLHGAAVLGVAYLSETSRLVPSPDDPWRIWQFTEKGIVYGINTKVDVNVYNGSLWSLKRLTLD